MFKSRFLRSLSIFTTGAATGYLAKSARSSEPQAPSVGQAANTLYGDAVANGWKPRAYMTEFGTPLYASIFPVGLTACTAYDVVEQEGQFHVLINLQKRNVDGETKIVADVPCGFVNADNPQAVARAKTALDIVTQEKRRLGHGLSGSEATALLQTQRNQFIGINSDNADIDVDLTFEHAARRELDEETGHAVATPGQHILSESVEGMHRTYHRYLYVSHLPSTAELPPLKPQASEGITGSYWINVEDIEFKKNADGTVDSGSVIIDGQRYEFKPTDRTAEILYYALGVATNNQFGDSSRPSEACPEPGVRPAVIPFSP